MGLGGPRGCWVAFARGVLVCIEDERVEELLEYVDADEEDDEDGEMDMEIDDSAFAHSGECILKPTRVFVE